MEDIRHYDHLIMQIIMTEWIKKGGIILFISMCILTTISKLNAINDPSKMNVYFISGLGADERVFSKLDIDPHFNVINIQWIRPKLNETLRHYVQRLSAVVDTTKPFQLVGMSFGGIIAQEMSTMIHPEQIILISSQTKGLPINRFNRGLISFLLASPFAGLLLKHPVKRVYTLFGVTKPDEKTLLADIFKKSNVRFMKWAIRQLTKWDRKERVPNVYQIHGDSDKMIKPELVTPEVFIPKGEHFMVYTLADQISPIVNRQLLKHLK